MRGRKRRETTASMYILYRLGSPCDMRSGDIHRESIIFTWCGTLAEVEVKLVHSGIDDSKVRTIYYTEGDS